MLPLLKLPNVKFIYLYTKPINMQWGKNKLKDLCLNEMKIDPNNQLFLFFNKEMNKLKLFFLDDDGEQEILRFLPKGNFILPVSKTNEIVIKINKNKLDSILKMR